MTTSHMRPCTRRCFVCGNVAYHLHDITPWVNCQKCGSQDTRLVRETKQKRIDDSVPVVGMNRILIESSDSKFLCKLVHFLNDFPIVEPDSTKITLLCESSVKAEMECE